MSDMSGNANYESAADLAEHLLDALNEGNGDLEAALNIAQLEATLALAYEQRTANLIALMAIGVTDMSGWPDEFVEVNIKRNEIIKARLGLNEGATK